MSKAEKSKVDFEAAQVLHKSNPLPRIGRMVLCVISMGMMFPNAFTEGVNINAYEEAARKENAK